jgi:hypothetical protein
MPIDIKGAQEWLKNINNRKKELGVYEQGDGNRYFTTKPNSENNLRILAVASTWFSGSHWNVLQGKDGKSGGTVKCPTVYDNSPCPVCEMQQVLMNSPRIEDQEKGKKLRLQVKHPMLVVDLNDQNPQVMIYEATNGVWDQTIKYSAKYGDITDPDNGRCAVLTRKDIKNQPTSYDIMFEPDRSSYEPPKSKLNSEEDLKKALKPRSYEDIQEALLNGSYPEKQKEDDEDIVEAPKPASRPAASRSFGTRPATSPASRKPTTYGQGLPAPKTRDEPELIEEEFDYTEGEYEEPAPEVKKQPQPAPAATSQSRVPGPRTALPSNQGESVQERLKRKMHGLK